MKKLIVVILMVVPSLASSNTYEIIYDSGDTLSMDKYYGKEIQVEPTKRNQKPSILSFPINTPSLTPNHFKPIEKHIPHFQTPLFIIGQDKLSREWLVNRRSGLIRLHAVGMVVEVDDIHMLNDILALGKGLKIYPVSGESIAEQLKIKHYPALISRFGIEQ